MKGSFTFLEHRKATQLPNIDSSLHHMAQKLFIVPLKIAGIGRYSTFDFSFTINCKNGFR